MNKVSCYTLTHAFSLLWSDDSSNSTITSVAVVVMPLLLNFRLLVFAHKVRIKRLHLLHRYMPLMMLIRVPRMVG